MGLSNDGYYKWFFRNAVPAAIASGHIFPEMAVCEAAEESTHIDHDGYSVSELVTKANNLFGLKQGRFTEGYPTVELWTNEYRDGGLVRVSATWPVFKSWQEAFSVRMEVLRGLAPVFPHYDMALKAADPITYVTEVSKTWSTDPKRAANVIALYSEWYDVIHQLELPLPSQETTHA